MTRKNIPGHVHTRDTHTHSNQEIPGGHTADISGLSENERTDRQLKEGSAQAEAEKMAKTAEFSREEAAQASSVCLKRDYLRIHSKNGDFYGGNQKSFPDALIQTDGCGLIAAADVIWYLHQGKSPLSEKHYQNYVQKLRPFFRFFPNHGMPSWALLWGLNRSFRHYHMPWRIHWGIRPSRRYECILKMLENDIPVIVAIGPNFPNRSGKKAVHFYERRENGSYEVAASTQGHYVVITGADHEWLRISSWGKEYYMNWNEFDHYAQKDSFWLFTNVCRITPK